MPVLSLCLFVSLSVCNVEVLWSYRLGASKLIALIISQGLCSSEPTSHNNLQRLSFGHHPNLEKQAGYYDLSVYNVKLLCTGKLGGMNENSTTVVLPASCRDAQMVCSRVYEVANVLLVSSSQPDNTLLFAAQSAASSSDVLVEVKVDEGRAAVKVNCDKIVIGQMLLKELKTVLARI